MKVGIIFGLFPVGTVCAMPFVPAAVRRFGYRRMVEVGLFASCACTLLFGLVPTFVRSPNKAVFFWISFRLIGGFASAFAETGMLALVSKEFSADIGKVLV